MRINMKIMVIGDFAFGQPVYSGQTAKCRDIFNIVSSRYKKVKTIDTRNWKRHIFTRSIKLIWSLFWADTYVLPLCNNGRKTIVPFLAKFKKLFKYRIFFPAVGGSLMHDYKDEPKLMAAFPKLEGIFFETKVMVNFFKDLGYDNIYYLPVFSNRKLTIEKQYHTDGAFKFCTYSRVIKEKGISSAIECIANINKKMGTKVCTLDIFGGPSDEYKEEFDSLLEQHKDCINNLPLLSDNAVDVLSGYYCLLFPTYYSGEGFPIALIECMKAGLPCICSDWHFNSEIITDGKTGYIFDLNDTDALERCVMDAIKNPEKVKNMSKNCMEEVKKFDPDVLFADMFRLMDECNKKKKDSSQK